MSVQFGRWNFDGAPADFEVISKATETLTPYAPDGVTAETTGSLILLFGAFHTTSESRSECQPYLSQSGDMILWDGRLDNRADVVRELSIRATQATDLEIVSAAYERWGTDSFSQLIGDWAMSVWSPSNQSVVLARDFLGARQLYYSLQGDSVSWSTILDPLVVLRNSSITVSEEYVAGWLATFAKPSLTPYEGILAVPPACYATVRRGRAIVRQFWRFDSERRTRHRTDQEYEEHFLTEFRKSLTPRLRADRPILAELSGGMDSSSVVCVADRLISEDLTNPTRVDTVSYYDDTEPNWDERPHFVRVEGQRGRAGSHIDVGPLEIRPLGESEPFLATPNGGFNDSAFARRFSACVTSGSYRVLLSGTGGDEVTGGVPTPLPELADLLVRFEFVRFGKQLLAWSLAKKKPVTQLFRVVSAAFLPPERNPRECPSWLRPKFVERHRAALCGYPERLRLFGPLPTFQANLFALDALRRQFASTPLPHHPTFEKRYPYLDRDFLAFCYSLPREQLLRPHQRRSLMRRAMAGIVPDEILQRKRKAFVSRRLAMTVAEASRMLTDGIHDMVCADLGIIEPHSFLKAMEDAGRGNDAALIPLLRALDLERWLRGLPPPTGIRSPLNPRDRADGNHFSNPRFLGREQFTPRGGD